MSVYGERKLTPVVGSYTNKLLNDKALSKAKVLEEVNELIEAIEEDTREFLKKPVPNKLISQLLQKASRSPSGGNLQPWKVYVINNDSMDKFLEFQNRWTEPEVPPYSIYPKILPNLIELIDMN